MSCYVVPTWNPAWVSKVGWHTPDASFWFVVYERDPFDSENVDLSADRTVVHLDGGLDRQFQIHSVSELVCQSWGEIKWNSEEGFDAVSALRDDASFDYINDPDIDRPADVYKFLGDALDDRRVVAWMRARGEHWIWPPVDRSRPAMMPTRRLKKAE